MSGGTRTAIPTIIGVAVIMLVIGAAIGSVAFPATKTVTLSPSHSSDFQTAAQTIVVMRTSTEISSVSESYSTTITVMEAAQAETITQLFVVKSGTLGGGIGCGGNLSANQCIGMGTLQLTFSTSTTFIFPSNATSHYFNATITQSTSSGTLTCGNYTTTTVTESYNKTSGLGSEFISWSGTCS